jgi:signal transduction histidine kinase
MLNFFNQLKPINMTLTKVYFRGIIVVLFFCITKINAQGLNATYEKKIDSIQESYSKLTTPIDKMKALYQVAKLYQATNFQKSDSINNIILQTAKKNTDEVGFGLYHLINSQNQITKGEYNLAFREAVKAEFIFKKKQETAYYLDAIYLKAFSLTLNGKRDEGLKLVLSFINDKKYKSYNEQIGQLYYFLAFYHLNIEKNLPKSLIYNEKALEIYRIINSRGVLKVYYNIAQIYIALNNFNKAEEYALLAINSNQPKSIELLQALNSILAYVNLENKKYIIAQKYCDKSLKLCSILGNDDITAITLLNSIAIDKELNQYDKMITKADKVLKLTEMPESKMYGNYYKGIAFYNKREFEKAKLYLTKASKFIDKNDRINYKEVYDALSKTFKSLNQFEEALVYREIFQSIEQEVYKNQNDEKINELQIKFDTKEKEIQLKNLTIASQKDKEIIIQKDNQRNLLLAIVAFLLLLALITYFLYNKIKIKNQKLKNQNKVIEEQNKQIKKSNETIKKTFSIVSHDLRGPFNVLMGYTNYISENCDSLTKEEIKTYLAIINNTATNNYNFTQQLLKWSLKQQKGIVLNKKYTDIREIVQKCLGTLSAQLEQKNISVDDYRLLPIMCYCDADIVFNIMYNILSNAVKFNNDNSTITIKSFSDNQYVYIETTDSGVGMDNEMVQKLNEDSYGTEFEFVIKDNEYQGGFGLLYAKELANLHKGKLVFESQVAIGTKVTLAIPILIKRLCE